MTAKITQLRTSYRWTVEQINDARDRAYMAAQVTLPIDQFNALLDLAEAGINAPKESTQ